jgi:hypothetical protein
MKKTGSRRKGILARAKERQELLRRIQITEDTDKTIDGITKIIAHCVAHGSIASPEFNVRGFIYECQLVMEDALILEYLIKDILDEAETKGLLEAKMPIGESLLTVLSGAAQVNPAYNPRLLCLINHLQNLLSEEK